MALQEVASSLSYPHLLLVLFFRPYCRHLKNCHMKNHPKAISLANMSSKKGRSVRLPSPFRFHPPSCPVLKFFMLICHGKSFATENCICSVKHTLVSERDIVEQTRWDKTNSKTMRVFLKKKKNDDNKLPKLFQIRKTGFPIHGGNIQGNFLVLWCIHLTFLAQLL